MFASGTLVTIRDSLWWVRPIDVESLGASPTHAVQSCLLPTDVPTNCPTAYLTAKPRWCVGRASGFFVVMWWCGCPRGGGVYPLYKCTVFGDELWACLACVCGCGLPTRVLVFVWVSAGGVVYPLPCEECLGIQLWACLAYCPQGCWCSCSSRLLQDVTRGPSVLQRITAALALAHNPVAKVRVCL
jgi:hypothetical protein